MLGPSIQNCILIIIRYLLSGIKLYTKMLNSSNSLHRHPSRSSEWNLQTEIFILLDFISIFILSEFILSDLNDKYIYQVSIVFPSKFLFLLQKFLVFIGNLYLHLKICNLPVDSRVVPNLSSSIQQGPEEHATISWNPGSRGNMTWQKFSWRRGR